ncbi:MAG: hypothetical protein EOO46_11680 [Flavobacterium sp.]|nr:MAG: hypothetical protein EOO46_11680 [Flavobacterium sp.]
MKITFLKLQITIIIVSSLSFCLFCSCKNFRGSSYDKLLVGTWKTTVHIKPEAFATESEEEIPEGMEMEMKGEETSTFHHGNKFNREGEFTVWLRNNKTDEEIPLRFYSKEAGTWKVFDETLVETTEDGILTPLDDLTKNFVAENPDIATGITPIKGETTSSNILSITEAKADMEELEHHLNYTMRKKQ